MATDIDTSTLNSTSKDFGTSPFANLRDSFKRVLSPDRSRADQQDQSPTSQDRSRSRGREFQSTGRGGAGNMVRSESVSRGRDEGVAGEERGREILPSNRVTHTGRGGAGNIRSPSRDPEGDIREMSREHEIIENHRKIEEGQIHSTGRGGFGNMDRSRSRSREPNRVVHSSGRGGFGNIAAGDGRDLADLEEEERVHHAHVPEFHSSGRGGAGNVVAGGGPAVEPAHAPTIAPEAQWRSSGRGGAGNMMPVQHKDPAAAAEEGRGRKPHSSIGGFIERLTSRSRDPQHHDN
ncbi:hypothetical protein RhiJN_17590 [Ceratobasidium sp. AG-Ba]|nr:hypothetical protein RhiJN_17590 [Ceratobasidium sp. AG-Ba]